MYVKVRVTAGVRKERVERVSRDHFKIEVKEKAQQNLANTRVVEIVANEFGVSKGKARIISGHHSPSKIISLELPDESR